MLNYHRVLVQQFNSFQTPLFVGHFNNSCSTLQPGASGRSLLRFSSSSDFPRPGNCFVGETSIFYPSKIPWKYLKSGFSWLNPPFSGRFFDHQKLHSLHGKILEVAGFFKTCLLQDFAIAGPWTLDDYGSLLWLTMIDNNNAIVIYHNYSHL